MACGTVCTSLPCKGFVPSRKGFHKDADSTEIPLSLLAFYQPYSIALQEDRNIFCALWSKVLHYHVTKENRLFGS